MKISSKYHPSIMFRSNFFLFKNWYLFTNIFYFSINFSFFIWSIITFSSNAIQISSSNPSLFDVLFSSILGCVLPLPFLFFSRYVWYEIKVKRDGKEMAQFFSLKKLSIFIKNNLNKFSLPFPIAYNKPNMLSIQTFEALSPYQWSLSQPLALVSFSSPPSWNQRVLPLSSILTSDNKSQDSSPSSISKLLNGESPIPSQTYKLIWTSKLFCEFTF